MNPNTQEINRFNSRKFETLTYKISNELDDIFHCTKNEALR